MRFLSIKLANWRNFKAADIPLQDRMFLVGPNASGKSNLLDAFRFLRDIASVGGGLREAVEVRGGIKKIRSLAATRNTNIAIEVQMGSEKVGTWEYQLVFNQRANDDSPTIVRETILRNGDIILNRPDQDDEIDKDRKTQTHLEQVAANKAFRDIYAHFANIKYMHIVPQLVRDRDRYKGSPGDPYGADLLELVAGINKKTQASRLKKIATALKVAVPQLTDLELDRDKRGNPHLKARYKHWRSIDAFQEEDQFSDGTLRLFGLLWVLLEGSGLLLLEEPELSLHPELIRHIPQLIARVNRDTKRQIFISTHSYDLLSDKGIGLDEVVMLLPDQGGTHAQLAKSSDHVRALLEKGTTMAEAILPLTAPADASQLALFGEAK